MALNTIADLSKTAASNTDFLGTTATGSGNASDIDTVRQNLAAMIARGYDDWGGVVTVGGSANAITVTSNSTYQTLRTGLQITLKAASANTTAATLNVDSLGAKAIRLVGDTALSAGHIAANGRYTLIYDSAYNAAAGAWVLMNPSNLAYTPGGTDVAVADGGTGGGTGAAAVLNLGLAGFFQNHISGLTLSNNGSDATNDIDIAVGAANDGGNTDVMVLGSAITKRLDAAWAVGTNQGGLDTGAIANTTYHMWLIKRPDTGVVDVLFSASASSPTMPTNYTLKRRIGSIVRTGGSIKAFFQQGDYFYWKVQTQDVATTNPGTSAVTATLTVPTGIQVIANTAFGIFDQTSSSLVFGLMTALDQTDTTPSSSAFSIFSRGTGGSEATANSSVSVRTNTSAQVRYRLDTSAADITAYVQTVGWADPRI